jgi:hypothetical protein
MEPIKFRWFWLIPTAAFLACSIFFIYRGTAGHWHDRCRQFWQERKWTEIRALANNLTALNRADSEVLYFAVFASRQLQDAEGEKRFASQLLQQRALNWNWEIQLSTLQQSRSIQELARLYRSRIILPMLLLIIILQSLYLWKKRPTLHWTAAISLIGIAILFL